MVRYKPLQMANQMVLGDGHAVIITGWTVAKTVAAKLPADKYAAVGQLYSAANGLSPLFRNLLANKGFKTLVLLSATKEDSNAGSVRCLHEFFTNGYLDGQTETGHPSWIVNSAIDGYIDKEIPASALDWIRANVAVHFTTSIKELVELCQKLPHTEALDVEPELYPLPALKSCPMFPGPTYGHVIRGERVADTWVKILNRIRTTGTLRPNGYDGQWQELIDLVAVVDDEPRSFFFPEPNYLPISRDFIGNYIGQVLDDAPYREGVKYTYGQRLRSWFGADQIELVIEKLIKEVDAASAVMNLWDVKDHLSGGSPCLNHIWVRVNGYKLMLTATFRSNDMYSAWPANAMGLRALQFHIIDEINRRVGLCLEAGPLITHSESAHIYDNCFRECDSLRAKVKSRPTFSDPAGNFIIVVDGDTVKATWTTPTTGATVKVYRGPAFKVLKEIVADIPYLEPGHAAYIGFELAKAGSAIVSGRHYQQDA